jgi:hypothetical protein
MMSEVYKITEHRKCMENLKADFIDDMKCIGCLCIAKDFRNDESFIDFLYHSGLCQNCQDK